MTLYYLLFYYFFPVLLVIFSIYLLGAPRILISKVNELLWVKVYKTSLPLITVTIILLLIPFIENLLTYTYDRLGFEDLIESQETFDSTANVELQMRKIFYKERNMLILLCFMLMMFVFLIFSSSYNKTYSLEDEIEKNKKILKGEEKSFSRKKND